ncbi:MAG TPA: ABC transporter ATP-binding protein [Dehalococcoidia bacterium]|nr:ABC transporter ATP-binding protein [Dehalococcoidia bacterium]
MTQPSQPVLVMEKVSKVFDETGDPVHALDSVDFNVNAGEVCLLMGPSGSGKTTLLTIAGALQRPTAGRVFIDGTEVTAVDQSDLPAIRKSKVGFIFQHFNLIPALTALDNVALVMSGGLKERRGRALELIESLGLGHRARTRPRHLSGGEKQRVAIARALANDPVLILADEPVSNLDAARLGEVLTQLRRLAYDLGKAVVIISHDHRVQEFATRTLWLEDGRFQDGPHILGN